MASTTAEPKNLSSFPTARSDNPDLHELMRAYITACNAPSFAVAKSFISPRVFGLYENTVFAISAEQIMQAVAMGFVCMAEPFKPHATVCDIKDIAPTPTVGNGIKGVYIELSMLGSDVKEADVAGRRTKVRYWWMKDEQDGLWKIVLEQVEDCGFEMKEGNWMADLPAFEKEQKEKGNWF